MYSTAPGDWAIKSLTSLFEFQVVNIFRNRINQTILTAAVDNQLGRLEVFNFIMVNDRGEGKLKFHKYDETFSFQDLIYGSNSAV